MSTYVFFNKRSGDIVHVHREYYMDSVDTVEIDEGAMIKELKDVLPKKMDIGILPLQDSLPPARDRRYRVDVRTQRLMVIEKPKIRKERKR